MASLQRSKSSAPDRPPLRRRLGAGLVLAGGVAIGIYLVIGIVAAVFKFLLVVAVIAAIAWAVKTLVW